MRVQVAADLWAGLFVSRKVPDAAVDRLNAAVLQALQNPEVRKACESTGNVVMKPMSGAALAAFYNAEIARYTATAKAATAQPQ